MICNNPQNVDTNWIYDHQHGNCFGMKDMFNIKIHQPEKFSKTGDVAVRLLKYVCPAIIPPSIVDHLAGFFPWVKTTPGW